VNDASDDLIAFGRLGRPHGVKGEMPLRPFNTASADLVDVPLPLAVRAVQGDKSRELTLIAVRPAGEALLVRLEGVETREAAAALTNAQLWVPRQSLPPPGDDEFYVEDLVGCQVVDTEGKPRGTVRATFWNGAQDVLTVDGPGGELMIPAVAEFLVEVDLEARRVVVDPHE
jgi:16S rRNA processing protein RimM